MIYSPAEDSFLLQEQVNKLSKNKSVLDIGSGSGILALSALESGAHSVLASDIDSESVRSIKSKNIPAVKSNLFKKIKGKFDIVIFNPPYLPLDKREDKESRKITTGGKEGDEIILQFLNEVKVHLTFDGFILLLVSSLTPQTKIKNLIKKLKMKKRKLSEKKLFMESLEVWKISKVI
jgi:release factor glutamine methyltransferase